MATLFNGDVQGTDNMARFICDTCNHEWTATKVLPCELCSLRSMIPDLARQLAAEQKSVDELARHLQDLAQELAEAREELSQKKTDIKLALDLLAGEREEIARLRKALEWARTVFDREGFYGTSSTLKKILDASDG